LSSTPDRDRHSTPGQNRRFNRGERIGEKGRKEKEKRGEREPIMEMRREGKKKKKKKSGAGPNMIFLFNEDYSSFSQMKSYCSNLTI
jgi:hypothetical protein